MPYITLPTHEPVYYTTTEDIDGVTVTWHWADTVPSFRDEPNLRKISTDKGEALFVGAGYRTPVGHKSTRSEALTALLSL